MFSPDKQSDLLQKLKLEATLFGYQENDPHTIVLERTLSDYEFIYNIGGNTLVDIDGRHYSLFAGDIVLIPSLIKHKIDTPMDNIHKNYWVHFNMEHSLLSQQLVASLIEAWNGHVVHIGIDPELIELYEKILHEQEKKSDFSFFLCQTYFKEIFIKILRDSDAKLDLSLSADNEVHRAVIDYVCKNYIDIHSVDDIANANNISLTYCNNIFKKYLGTSPAKYIIHLKLKKAENMLRYSQKSIYEISMELKFSSQYHFANTFKAHYQITPTEYRKLKFKY